MSLDVRINVDYYPFGMLMPGRHSGTESYRYGFNGMEKDDEVKGGGNSYTTEFRQYDPRLGRWLSLDPLANKFSWQSPYVAFDNNPILIKDPNGLAGKNAVGDPEKERKKSTKKRQKAENKFAKKLDKYNSNLQANQQLNRRQYSDMLQQQSTSTGSNSVKTPRWFKKYLDVTGGGTSSITGWLDDTPEPVGVFGGTSINPNPVPSITSSGGKSINVPFSTGTFDIEISSNTQGGRGGTWSDNVNVQVIDSDGNIIVNSNITTIVNPPAGSPNESINNVSFVNSGTGSVSVVITGGNFITGYTATFTPDLNSYSKPVQSVKKNPQYNLKKMRRKSR